MRVHWTTDYTDAVGNSLGYATHNAGMRSALVAAGGVLDDAAPLAMHVVPGHRFAPVAGKFNAVSTAWEAGVLPELWRTTLADADVICPTASFLAGPLRRMFPDKPIEPVSLGCDFARFGYVDRASGKYRPLGKKRPFRFLWLGAPNARKGVLHAREAWKAFAGNDACELYIKTTRDDKQSVERHGNIIYDTRKLPLVELVRIYQRAHCLLWCSVGEGFGLPLLEATATGMPAIYTPATAMLDILPVKQRLGYPIRYEWQESDWSWSDADARGTAMEVRVQVANPLTDSIAENIDRVLLDPLAAFAVGRRAYEHVRTRFTWQRCGETLLSVLRDYFTEESYGRTEATQTA